MHRQVFNLRGQEIYSPDKELQLEVEDNQSVEFIYANPLGELGATALELSILSSLDKDSTFLWFRAIKSSTSKRKVYTDGLNLMIGVTNRGHSQSKLLWKFLADYAGIQKTLEIYSNFYEALGKDFVNAQSAWGVYLAQYLKNL